MASKPRDRDRAGVERRRRIASDFAKRHPEKAREERLLRKSNARLAEWGNYREATPQTLQKAAQVQQGALARLFMSGTIDAHQLASSQEIRGIHERIGADVGIRTVSLETRIDNGSRGDSAFFESLRAVRSEVAYTRWREELNGSAAAVLSMVADDVGIEEARRRHGLGRPKAKRLLLAALDLWAEIIGEVCKEIDEASVLAAHAGILS
jgi:hypothetical protein